MKRSEIVGTLYRELFTDASCDSLPMIDGLGRFMRSPTVLMALDGREGSRQVAVQQIFIREDWRTYSAFFAESASLSSQTVPDKISHFMRIVENAPLGILAIDETAHITFCNSAFCAFLNETQHKVIGKALLTYIDERYHDVVSDHLQEYTATQPQTGKMFEAALMGEESRSVLFYIGALERPSLNDPSGVTGVPLVLYVIDVTQNRRLEEQLTQSQKMQAIGQLAGSIAHDFNNLLTAMIGYCDLLLGRYSPADQSFTDVMQIKQNANRASHLVRQLLAFSRKQTLQPKVLDITDIVSELSALLQRLLGVKIDLRITYGRDLRLVRVDPIQLEQVIINISVNARDAMPDGGALTIKTYAYKTIKSVLTEGDIMPPGQYTVVEMQDTGIGIKAKDLPYIFDPFYSTKQKGAGTGLGLATVYGIVKQTGGFIKVSSIKDKGTTFSVFFPAYEGHEQPERTTYDFSVSRTLSRDLTGTGTILLVEDEEAVRLFSARALRNKGYTVVDVEDGEAALTYLQAHLNDPIDLLITDVMMPKMDGPTLMKEVRKTHPDLKVIFVSGYTQDKFRQDLGQGAHLQFLSKPFDIKELAEKVKGVLGMKNFS
jgi:two-component system cell cycle sensor histidine kinase/response regulator CckA